MKIDFVFLIFRFDNSKEIYVFWFTVFEFSGFPLKIDYGFLILGIRIANEFRFSN